MFCCGQVQGGKLPGSGSEVSLPQLLLDIDLELYLECLKIVPKVIVDRFF